MTAGLEVEGLAKEFAVERGRVPAIRGVSFTVQDGMFYTLLGPSGCGKTTTLRCVAGLERADRGRIAIAGTIVSADRPPTFVPPDRRDIGMVFQSYAIWPHLTVFENAAFPLRVRRPHTPEKELERMVYETLATVQLERLATRNATQLSGGQQQRLALARALVRRPKLLLLDEPLSNLDAKLREQMRGEVRELQRRLGIATLYVTHDQVEALSMSDRIAVMSAGRIVQEGEPREIYERPADPFVADFVGSGNFIQGEVVDRDGPVQVRVRTALGDLVVTDFGAGRPGEPVTVFVRPENVRVHADGGDGIPATVESVTFLGEFLDCRLRAGEQLLHVRQHPLLPLTVGRPVRLELPPDVCVAIRGAGT
jgi:iron(III) transport system ATP-binding protein